LFWQPAFKKLAALHCTENEMNMKGQQKKEKGKVYLYSIRRERIIDEKEMLQNVSTKQIYKE
jgi:hypothetical protein